MDGISSFASQVSQTKFMGYVGCIYHGSPSQNPKQGLGFTSAETTWTSKSGHAEDSAIGACESWVRRVRFRNRELTGPGLCLRSLGV